MDEKLLLTVLSPPARRDHEVNVPLGLTVGAAADLISELLARLEPALYRASAPSELVLIDGAAARPGEMLNANETIRTLVDQGILVDGSRVAVL